MRKKARLFSLFSVFLAASLTAPPLSSQILPRATRFQGFCGAPPVDPATRAAVERQLAGADRTLPKAGSIRIPVAVHLITSGREGVVSRSVVNVLIRNLNAAFAATPFSFYLKKMDKTKNATWYSGCTDPEIETAMKKRLAYKPAQVLNLYSCKTDGAGYNGVLGYSYYPWTLPEAHYLQVS